MLFCYFACPAKYLKARNLILLLFSIGFYFFGEPKYTAVMLFSIFINYAFGFLIHKSQEKGLRRRGLLVAAVIINLLVLVYFKYLTFITENVNALFGLDIQMWKIVMPIGISFFTFQAMSYVFDVYQKTAEVQKNPLNVALYISMFPQLIAGPVVRYETVAAEIKSRTSTIEKTAEGIIRFIYGLAKKIILANAMGQIADQIFAVPTAELSGQIAWLGAIAYTFQIYYDFSGYSDMAIGLGKILGFTFLENFNFPYISRSITEFWRRWHISLSSWFKDYVYIPLGGNRVGRLRGIVNILLVWLLTGIWHGAAWNFAVWGLYFAVILVLEKAFLNKLMDRLWRPASHIYAVVLIIIGWVIFRSENLAYAAGYIAKMFQPQSFFAQGGQAVYYLLQYRVEWILAALFSLPVGRFLVKKLGGGGHQTAKYAVRLCFVFLIFGLSILSLVNSTFNPFIYFRF